MEYSRLKLLFIAVCIALAGISATALQIITDYRQTLAQQETSMRDMTHVVELQITDTMRLTGAILDRVEGLVEDEADLLRFRNGSLDQLAAYCRILNGCVTITVIEPGGEVVARSTKDPTRGINVADRTYFRHAVSKGGLFVAPAVATRMPGNPVLFAISKPVLDPSGKLVAVVAAHLLTNHFTDFYGLMGFNLDPTVTIFKGDGTIVARHPDMAKHVGKSSSSSPVFTELLPRASSGVYRSLSALDGKTRISAYQYLPRWDLLIICGTEVDTAMASWKERSLWTAATGSLGLLFIFLILFWGFRSFMHQKSLIAQNNELDRISNIDPLTGIANRRMFDAVLAREWHASKYANKDLSLLLIDVDYFKNYNDQYGHPEGDRCLSRIAAALQSSLHRKEDLVARYGGEEFGVILNSGEAGATDVAERMRLAVQSLRIPHASSEIAPFVTISIGAANASGVKNIEELLAGADAALYRAKSEGRNRTVWQSA